MPKYAQPDLNFIGMIRKVVECFDFIYAAKCFAAPEIQHKSECGVSSDMFSLGMLMIAVFNGGQSLIQANHSTNLYFKQAGVVRRSQVACVSLIYHVLLLTKRCLCHVIFH